MKKLLIVLSFSTSLLTYIDVNAAQHHGGHRGASRGAASGNCSRPQFEKFLPPNMATVAPGSEFSFRATNIEKPEQLEVTAKKLPVTVNLEFKDPYYVVTGKLPDSLRNTVARINVKLNAKISACEAETGWLVKISE
ncbi:hypothetical protein [Crenothrix sp.]|uniref:hypothetical protein n=1 Tax=Crenothrix sp. TaxID=3100433 RepID=UPI00374D17C9